MATIGELHTIIRDAVARGTSLDAIIPARLRMAARWVERNHTYQYMKKFGIQVINPLAARPDVIVLPSPYWKAIPLVRWRFAAVPPDLTYRYVRIEPLEEAFQLAQSKGLADGYIFNGTSEIILNAVPDKAWTLELFWHEFTNWPTDLAASNWLTIQAEDLLLAQTVLLMGVFQRDPRMLEFYKGMRDEALKTTIDADLEFQEAGESQAIIFMPQGGLDWNWDEEHRWP